MSRTIRYYQPTRKERLAAALQDAKQYLTVEQQWKLANAFDQICIAMPNIRQRLCWMYIACEFAGVRGLPAKALVRGYFNLQKLKAYRDFDARR